MRILAVAIFLLAAISAAAAQCAIGAFPTTNGDGQVVCQSAGGQSRPSEYSPGGNITTCPEGTTSAIDAWGNRTCSSLSQKPLQQGFVTEPPKKPKKKKFEISNKCPLCK